MSSLMTAVYIRRENRQFRGTAGISLNNRSEGFRPAFCDTDTGRVEPSCFAPGMPAPIHMLSGMPEEWVVARDTCGAVIAVKASVISGFVRGGQFYTRDEVVRASVN